MRAHILLGNALAGLRDMARALRQIEEAIALDPSFAPEWTALGAIRLRDGSSQSAAAAFERAVVHDPASIDARLALALPVGHRQRDRRAAHTSRACTA
jgi:Tfp pilus assembly protein PilF